MDEGRLQGVLLEDLTEDAAAASRHDLHARRLAVGAQVRQDEHDALQQSGIARMHRHDADDVVDGAKVDHRLRDPGRR